MHPPTTFETERLHLRPVQRDDAKLIFQTYASGEEPTRYMDFPRHRALAESEAFAERCVQCWNSGSAFPWVIIGKQPVKFMGVIELRLSPPKADFGYIIGERFWGRGFATEAAKVIADWTMEQPSIHRLWATCHPENAASPRVLAKAGLMAEATLANWGARPQLGEVARPCGQTLPRYGGIRARRIPRSWWRACHIGWRCVAAP
jgi:[ribosomal protein S5]-alanine N-acetyltransferase